MNDTAQQITDLAHRRCKPCQGGVPALKGQELKHLSEELDDSWQVINEHHLVKDFDFKDFREALEFTNQLGELAEAENHHPDIYLSWGKVRVAFWTHKVDGLTENDFIMAAKTDQLLQVPLGRS